MPYSNFHLNNLNIPIQNAKCPKNAKNACPDITFLPGGSLFGTWVPISMLRGHKILVPVHLIFSMTGAGKETVTHHISHWLWSKRLAIDQVLLLDRSCSEIKEIWRDPVKHISCQLTIADDGQIFLFRVATGVLRYTEEKFKHSDTINIQTTMSIYWKQSLKIWAFASK